MDYYAFNSINNGMNILSVERDKYKLEFITLHNTNDNYLFKLIFRFDKFPIDDFSITSRTKNKQLEKWLLKILNIMK
jgi:hypothetical protein